MQSTGKFTRVVENFMCEHCGADVAGGGYTNHCPVCLWSKHVDVYPGDRAEECQGLMEPKSAFNKGGQWYIVHACTVCGKVKNNKMSDQDDFDLIINLSANPQ
jgi:hypothetical protein